MSRLRGQDERSELTFRWLGVAGVELEADGQVLLCDPYLTRLGFVKQLVGRVEPDRERLARYIPHADHILVTHAHYDHLLDVPAIARRTGALCYGSDNTCDLLLHLGVAASQVIHVQPGDELRLGGFVVQVWPGEHIRVPGFRPGPLPNLADPPLRARDYRMDQMLCFQVQISELKILIEPGLPVIAEESSVLFTAAYKEPEYYVDLVEQVRPALVVPIHWDAMWRDLHRPLRPMPKPPKLEWPPVERIDPLKLSRLIEQRCPDTRVLVPEPLKRYRLSEELALASE